jgi:hypothetical protein
MTIQSKTLGTASALVAGATFVICALAVAVAPAATAGFLGWVLHIDLSSMPRHVSIANFFGGLIIFSVFVGLCVGCTAWLYNKLRRQLPPAA